MDNSQIYSQVGGPALIGLAIVLFVIIVLIIFSRISRTRKDGLAKPGRLDLIDLKKQGLLTPEEMERVSQAMLRQMERQDQKSRRITSAPTPDNLLLDPEVRRLQALAGAAKSDKEKRMERPVEEQPDQMPTAPRPDESAAVAVSPEKLAAVELPLDVQHLADSGLLSDEEVLNIKRRLLERSREG